MSVKSRLDEWIKQIESNGVTIPHDSYDMSCCDGENKELREQLLKKLKEIRDS